MSRIVIALPLLAAASMAHAAASAVAVSGLRTTVAAGEPQVFSARFNDAQGRPIVGETVRWGNDACGTFSNGAFIAQSVTDAAGVASMTFNALPTGFIRCQVAATATSGGGVVFDVITFRADLVRPTITTSLDPVEPRPGQPYRVTARARIGAFDLYNVDVGAQVVPGTAGAAVAGSTFNSGQDGYVQFQVTPDGRVGDYDLQLTYRSTATRVPMKAPANPWQDLWWSGYAENGWGMSIVQHRDMLFSIIYAYDEAGKAIWYVMPSGEWNDAHTEFSGDVFVPRGSPYNHYDVAKFDVGAPAGRATLRFNGANTGMLDYTIRGLSGSKPLTRILFGQGSASRVAGVGDMWWGGLAQNGWGFSVLQQGADLFTLWFTYDAAGAPTWFVMPSGSWPDARTFRGSLYRATGSPWLGRTYDSSVHRVTQAGWLDMRFNEDGTATFTYSVDGSAPASLPLARIPF